MEDIPKHSFLETPPNIVNDLRKRYDLDKPGRMDEAIDILDLWVKKQNHFNKKDFPRKYLERIIISTKGSIERAKMRIDKYCTLKTLMPAFFEKINVKTELGDQYEVIRSVILPKTTEDHYRCFLLQLTGKPFNNTHFLDFYRQCTILLEYIRAQDYCDGYLLIIDYRSINIMDLISHLDLTEMRQAMTFAMEGYGMRIKGIHLITSSKLIEHFVKALKGILNEKVGGRIKVHKDVNSLYAIVPKTLLPEELGGTEGSIVTLQGKWINILSSEEHISYMKEMQKAYTNESLRQTDKFNDKYLGMPGCFRTLNVD